MNRIFTLFLMLMAGLCRAQVHQQGGGAIDLSVGKTGIGVIGGLSYSRNFTDASYLQLRGLVEIGRMYNFKYSHFGADAMVFTSPFYISDFFQLNIGGGITLGYEKVNGITKDKADNIGFMAGFKGGAQAEAFLSDQLSFFVYTNQAYMVKKSLGNSYYEVGLGLRLFLNNY